MEVLSQHCSTKVRTAVTFVLQRHGSTITTLQYEGTNCCDLRIATSRKYYHNTAVRRYELLWPSYCNVTEVLSQHCSTKVRTAVTFVLQRHGSTITTLQYELLWPSYCNVTEVLSQHCSMNCCDLRIATSWKYYHNTAVRTAVTFVLQRHGSTITTLQYELLW